MPSTIPAGTYPSLTTDVPIYAVTATLVTRSDIDADIVEALVSDTLAALPSSRCARRCSKASRRWRCASRGLTAPLHPGAEAAFAAAATGG